MQYGGGSSGSGQPSPGEIPPWHAGLAGRVIASSASDIHDEPEEPEAFGTELTVSQGEAPDMAPIGTVLTITMGEIGGLQENVGTSLTLVSGADPASGGRMSDGRYRR